MWNKTLLLSVRVRADRVRLWVPVPLWVLDDTLASIEDLCQIVLPRLGMPNYAAALRDLIRTLDVPGGEPLVEVSADDVFVRISAG